MAPWQNAIIEAICKTIEYFMNSKPNYIQCDEITAAGTVYLDCLWMFRVNTMVLCNDYLS